jgi:hypothetical protein
VLPISSHLPITDPHEAKGIKLGIKIQEHNAAEGL